MSLTEVDWSTIPAPEDDGAAAHLEGMALPAAALPATMGPAVDLSRLEGRVVLYVYPRTGRPGLPLPEGWNEIPGARGCTPQTCAFRDHYQEVRAAGADHVFGLSTQDADDQREAAKRLHLPFPLLSDAEHRFGAALRLPSFEVEGTVLWKRLAFVAEAGRIVKVFYPIFPPDRNARDVLAWLTYRQAGGSALEGMARP